MFIFILLQWYSLKSTETSKRQVVSKLGCLVVFYKVSIYGMEYSSVGWLIVKKLCNTVRYSLENILVFQNFSWKKFLQFVQTEPGDTGKKIHVYCTLISGQSILIPHSGPFSHLRCGNGSQTYLNLYICI